MKILHIGTAVIACSLLLIAGGVKAASMPILTRVSFEAETANKERVTFTLTGHPMPVIFAIKGDNPRVVFDFPNTALSSHLVTSIDTGGKLITKIRIGLHQGEEPKARVVFDLVSKRNIEIDKVFNDADKTLTVTVTSKTARNAGITLPEPEKEQPPQEAGQEPAKEETIEEAPPTTANSEETSAAAEQPRKEETPQAQPEKETAAGPPADEEMATTQPDAQIKPEAAATQSSGTPLLSSVKFDKNSNRGEMVLFKLNDFYPPVVFGIEEEMPRVVCDFMDTKITTSVPSIIDCNGDFVKTVRIGVHENPTKVRAVLDLAPNHNYDLQQVFFKEDNLFVLIINTFENANKEKEKKEKKVESMPRRGDRLNSF